MAKTVNSFKNNLDRVWQGSDVMFNPDTNVHEVTAARKTRYMRMPEEDQTHIDLMQEA